MAVSAAVCEIFSTKEWYDFVFENMVMVRSRSLEMAPFDRSHTSFLFTFHSNYGAILSRLRLIGRKSGNLYTPPQPPVFSAPVGVTVGIS